MQSKVESLVGRMEPLLAIVRRWKPTWFGHVTRHDSLSKNIMHGTIDGNRRHGRQCNSGTDNVMEWMSRTMPDMLVAVEHSCPHDDYSCQWTDEDDELQRKRAAMKQLAVRLLTTSSADNNYLPRGRRLRFSHLGQQSSDLFLLIIAPP